MKFKKLSILLAICFLVVIFNIVYSAYYQGGNRFHTEKESEQLKHLRMAPIQPGEYFLHSDNCQGCHGYDSLQYANIDAEGNSVNVYDDWQATMMANSAKDPLWRAKVSHEILVNPSHANELQTKCTSCHAPMGNYTAKFKGHPHYTMSDLENDSLGLDGISCVSCHSIGSEGLGSMFSGDIPYDTTKKLFGPFQNPVTGPMQLYVGMTPVYSPHVSDSKVCSSCHTLITNSADLNGNSTGRTFVEQATFHEWLNSAYKEDNITCQNCHMPKVLDSVIIANMYFNLPGRAPFNKHKFTGANEFMLKLMKNNKSRLNISASDRNYDSTIAITKRNLHFNTLNAQLTQDSISNDTLFVSLKLKNKAGHKFPSGYPSRRAVVQLIATGTSGDTIFSSGVFDRDFEIMQNFNSYFPHYNVINSPSQVQVYEMVMGDVNGNRTSVLERADTMLKDNRIPPEGFSILSEVYDTVKIVGDAASDPDFNRDPFGWEGSASDIIHYHIPLTTIAPIANIYAKVFYQAVPKSWLQELFSYNSAPIDTFRVMFNSADKAPVVVAADSIINIPLSVNKISEEDVVVFPSPTTDGKINIRMNKNKPLNKVVLYNMQGQKINEWEINNASPVFNHQIELPPIKGAYLLEIYTKKQTFSKKVLFN